MLLLWAGAPLACQAQLYPIEYHGQDQGLGNLVVKALVQDRRGYLWVGTENGLYRYDGGRFVRWGGAAVRNVNALHLEGDARLWVGTEGGLYVVLGDDVSPVRLNGQSLPIGPRENLISAAGGKLLLISQGRLIELSPPRTGERAGDHTGEWLTRPYFDAAQLKRRPELAAVRHIYQTRDGSLWLACSKSLCRLKRGAGSVEVVSGLPTHDQAWSEMFEDHRGDLWVRSWTHVLQRPHGATSFIDRTPAQPMDRAGLATTPIVEDGDGRILTNSRDGIARWQGSSWEEVDAPQGLSAPGGVEALLVDQRGGLWLGTAGRGLAQWAGYGHLTAWTAVSGLGNEDVWSFLRDRTGSLHIATGAGVFSMAPGASRLQPEWRSPWSSQPSSMAQDGAGNIWIGDYSGRFQSCRRALRCRSAWRSTP